MEQHDYKKIAGRLGKDLLARRLQRQIKMAAKFYARSQYVSFHLENIEWLPVALRVILKITGLFNRGQSNALDYSIEHVKVGLLGLPPAFNGFRILQLSDLHADAIADNGRKLISMLENIEVDLCVITGDFRFLTQHEYRDAVEKTATIIKAVSARHGIYGILGNHDFIEMVPGLEAAGIVMLLNEAVPIREEGEEIWLAGIDDAHIYNCHDIKKSLSNTCSDSVRILLSHTPETYREAAAAGVDYLFCGHTHGGQICLPGHIPFITNAGCPRKICSGFWQYKYLQGYTSRGTGASGLTVRFFCPPEITIHELYSEKKEET